MKGYLFYRDPLVSRDSCRQEVRVFGNFEAVDHELTGTEYLAGTTQACELGQISDIRDCN